MIERPENQEQSIPSEPTGLPADLFDDPAKYDGDIPLWRRTVNLVRQFESARPKKQEGLLDQTANTILRDFSALDSILNNLNLISDLKPEAGINEIKNRLIGHIERAVARRSDLHKWNPEKIERLIKFRINSSGETAVVAEKMEAALFNAPKTIEEAVDIVYYASFAMAATDDDRVREEVYSILCYEKTWYDADSKAAVYHFVGGGVSSDDLHLARFHAAEFALRQVGQFLEIDSYYRKITGDRPSRDVVSEPPRVFRREAKANKIPQDMLEDLRDSQMEKNPNRFNRLLYFPEINVNRRMSEIVDKFNVPMWLAMGMVYEQIAEEPWPANIIEDRDEPLRKFVMEYFNPILFKKVWEQSKKDLEKEGFSRLTNPPLQLEDNFFIDIMAQNCESQEQRDAIVRTVYEGINQLQDIPKDDDSSFDKAQQVDNIDNRIFDQFFMGDFAHVPGRDDIRFAIVKATSKEEKIGKLASVIEYHRPLMSGSEISAVEDQLDEMRSDLSIKFSRTPGRRGYEVVVADPSLRQFGYRTITFFQEGQNVRSRIDISGEEYEFIIDPNYKIIKGGDIETFKSSNDRAWLELLSISHLIKVMCTDEDRLRDELLEGRKQYELYRKQIIGRIEHLRRLPPGQNFSSEAYIKCLKSDLPVKQLDRINKMRAERGLGGTKETGIWTYISGIERNIETGQANPIKVAFANATDDMRKVIQLGEISTEERERIEKEILDEIGNI